MVRRRQPGIWNATRPVADWAYRWEPQGLDETPSIGVVRMEIGSLSA